MGQGGHWVGEFPRAEQRDPFGSRPKEPERWGGGGGGHRLKKEELT